MDPFRGHEACEAIRKSLKILCRRRVASHSKTKRIDYVDAEDTRRVRRLASHLKFRWIYHVNAEGTRRFASHLKAERIHSVDAESTRRVRRLASQDGFIL
jgi:hypothetical protein